PRTMGVSGSSNGLGDGGGDSCVNACSEAPSGIALSPAHDSAPAHHIVARIKSRASPRRARGGFMSVAPVKTSTNNVKRCFDAVPMLAAIFKGCDDCGGAPRGPSFDEERQFRSVCRERLC